MVRKYRMDTHRIWHEQSPDDKVGCVRSCLSLAARPSTLSQQRLQFLDNTDVNRCSTKNTIITKHSHIWWLFIKEKDIMIKNYTHIVYQCSTYQLYSICFCYLGRDQKITSFLEERIMRDHIKISQSVTSRFPRSPKEQPGPSNYCTKLFN